MKKLITVHLLLRFLYSNFIYFAFDPNVDLVLVIITVVCTICYMPSPT